VGDGVDRRRRGDCGRRHRRFYFQYFRLTEGGLSASNPIPSLTGLRGVAACSVLFAHAMDTALAYEPMLPTFCQSLSALCGCDPAVAADDSGTVFSLGCAVLPDLDAIVVQPRNGDVPADM